MAFRIDTLAIAAEILTLINAIADHGLNGRFIAGPAMPGWREADLAGAGRRPMKASAPPLASRA